jgi:competence protein ComGC
MKFLIATLLALLTVPALAHETSFIHSHGLEGLALVAFVSVLYLAYRLIRNRK